MSDFFSRLAGRSMELTRVVQPRIGSRYAAPVQVDADTEVVREPWLEQSKEVPAATRLQEERGPGHSSRSPPHARDAFEETDSRAATRVVAADGVESEGAAVQDGLNPVRAESLPAGSRTRSNAIEARLEVPGPEAVASAEWPAAQVLDARQTERPAEADARVEPNRRVRAAIAAPSPLAPIAPDIQQPPLNSLGATRQNNQENPARVASPPLGEPAPPRRAAEHLARDLELDAAPAPEIHVSIGRIEVRAMTQPLVQPPRARPPSAGPALSLEAYLQKRLEGSR